MERGRVRSRRSFPTTSLSGGSSQLQLPTWLSVLHARTRYVILRFPCLLVGLKYVLIGVSLGAAIILASENELVKSCATAFYRLHCLYRPLLFYDYCDIPERDMFPHELPVTIKNLSAQQIRQFTDGREILRALPKSLFLALPDVMVTFRVKYDPLCCKDAIRAWCGEGRVWNTAERKHEDDPLGLLNELIKLLPNATPPPNNNNVCLSCRCSMQDWLELIREYIWENLPIYFGISGALPVHRNSEELKSRLRRVRFLHLVSRLSDC